MYTVYILHSEKLDCYYVGQTRNFPNRLKRHNSGYEKYTKRGLPWVSVWSTDKATRSEAVILEKKLKNLNRRRLEQFIQKYQ